MSVSKSSMVGTNFYMTLSFLLLAVSFAAPPNGLTVYHPASQIIAGIFPENYTINGTLNITPTTSAGTNFFVTSTGALGIGTATPGKYKLNVIGDINASWGNFSSLNVNSSAYIGDRLSVGTSDTSNRVTIRSSSDSSNAVRVLNSAGNAILDISEESDNSGTINIYNSTGATNIALKSAGNSYFSGYSGGNVGIGTVAPYRKLQINSTGGVSFETNESAYLAIRNNQRVGINTTVPGGVLHVNNSGTDFFVGNGRVGIGTANPDSKLAVTGNISSTTGAVFATSSGSVGINTTAPGTKLDVRGIISTQFQTINSII